MGTVYKVNILKWVEHNPKHKKGYKSFMFNNAFFSDHKIAQLKPIECVFFIYMLCVASETSSNQCQISVESLPKHMRIGVKLMHDCLRHFELLQLVVVEEMPSLRTKLIKLKELNISVAPKKSEEPAAPLPAVKANKVVALYCDLWKSKYNARPVITGKDAGILSQLVKDLGEKRASELVDGYMRHPSAMFAERRHDLGTLRLRLQDVSHFIDTGAYVNRRALSEAEDKQHYEAKYSPTPEQQEELRQVFEPTTKQLGVGK